MTPPTGHGTSRWRFKRARRILRPANRLPLDAWVSDQRARFAGLVLNVGAGEDDRLFGRRTIRLDGFAPGATVRSNLGSALPFQNDVFDGVVCTEVLEHVPAPDDLLREIVRVVKPNGIAIFTMPFFFHYHADPEDFTRLTPPGLRLQLNRAGFDVELVAGLGGKIIAALMLLESIHGITKLAVRSLLLPFHPLLSRANPVNDRWSDCAANVVAVARKRHAGR